jgi:hypothetical protein
MAHVDPATLNGAITAFVAYYLATRPLARHLDPQLVRRICAETLLARQRDGRPLPELPQSQPQTPEPTRVHQG